MLARLAFGLRSQSGVRFIKPIGSAQARWMGGGGAFMETNKFGENLGEFFGTIAWLWVFHRFNQDGAVLLGYQHPWEHGHDHNDHGHGHGHGHSSEKLTAEEVTAKWEIFSQRSTIPGDDDDDDDDDDDEDDDDDDDEE